MARITPEEVQRIADLARLSLSAEEVEALTGHMDSILDYVDLLSTLDTSDVEPTSFVTEKEATLRPDASESGLTVEEALQNAPQREGSAFGVPKVIEGEEG